MILLLIGYPRLTYTCRIHGLHDDIRREVTAANGLELYDTHRSTLYPEEEKRKFTKIGEVFFCGGVWGSNSCQPVVTDHVKSLTHSTTEVALTTDLANIYSYLTPLTGGLVIENYVLSLMSTCLVSLESPRTCDHFGTGRDVPNPRPPALQLERDVQLEIPCLSRYFWRQNQVLEQLERNPPP